MKAVQIITLFITMIAVFLCCFFIADARSATEEKTTEGKNMEEETAAESEGDAEGEKPAEAANKTLRKRKPRQNLKKILRMGVKSTSLPAETIISKVLTLCLNYPSMKNPSSLRTLKVPLVENPS